jgi:hypothetical protein
MNVPLSNHDSEVQRRLQSALNSELRASKLEEPAAGLLAQLLEMEIALA